MSDPKPGIESPKKYGDALVYGPGEIKVAPDFMEKAYKYAQSKIDFEKKSEIEQLEEEIRHTDEQIVMFSQFHPASPWLAHLKSQKIKFEKLLAELKA
jgi:hypothetical protein